MVLRVLGIVIALLLIAIGLLWSQSSLEPDVWVPEPNPGLTGVFATNQALNALQPLLQDEGLGPEDIAVGPDGWLYTGYRDGRIVRFKKDGRTEAIVNTGGVPLGLAFDLSGNLLVADATLGLLSVSKDRKITTLVNSVEGQPVLFADGVDVARDGSIWFSDASADFDYDNHLLIFLDGRANGRLIRYDPVTKESSVVLHDLFFANGVAIAADDSYVLVNETAAGRIRRFWRSGPKAGTADVFIGGLPGVPDNIRRDASGRFWVGLAGLRDPALDRLAPFKFIRRLLGGLSKSAIAPHNDRAMIIALDDEGRVLANLQAAPSPYATSTGAVFYNGSLFICSLQAAAIGEMPYQR
ncbi:MAG: SMP-30/gluconolactonase/LRE family protein [Woeseiaceae bacterium]